MDKKLLWSIGLLFIVLITQYAHCAPAGDDDTDYLQDVDNDDEYPFDDQNEDDISKKSSTTPESVTDVYQTETDTKRVDAGKRALLQCKGKLDENAVTLWYNGTNMITSGKQMLNTDPRIKVDLKTGSMIIDKVDSYDSGIYKCRQILNKNEKYDTNINLIVAGPPKTIHIGHNRDNKNLKPNEVLSYKAGEKDLRFKCMVGGAIPKAKFSWIHKGSVIEEVKEHDIKLIEANILEIKVLHAKHAGEYVCEATNEYGSIKAHFNIEVQYAPIFHQHHSYFNAEIGDESQIICAYKASPTPNYVKWFRNGQQIHENNKYSISADMKENYDRTKLLIKDVSKDDLGSYHCEVQNALGTKRENITLDLLPAPPKFEGYKYINYVLYTDWIVKSHQELESMIILYRNNVNGWKTMPATITHKSKVRPGEWKVQGTLSLPAGNWTVAGQAKNSNGWSNDVLAQHSTITIPKDSTESAEITSSASPIVSSACVSLIVLSITRYFV